MKVRVWFTVDVTAEERAAIGHVYGAGREANAAMVRTFFASEAKRAGGDRLRDALAGWIQHEEIERAARGE